jgi:hypothetical protein
VEQALKKQIIMAFEPVSLEILNNDIVGLSNTTARDMLDHLFISCGSITDVDLEHNWEICVKHGIHINLWSLYSSRFRIAFIMQEQGVTKAPYCVSQDLCNCNYPQCLPPLE